eukprot:g22132.t1
MFPGRNEFKLRSVPVSDVQRVSVGALDMHLERQKKASYRAYHGLRKRPRRPQAPAEPAPKGTELTVVGATRRPEEQFSQMVEEPWFNEAAQRIEYQMLTYNAMLNLYTLAKLEFTFELDGRMIQRFQHESFQAEPYLSVTSLIPDIMFLLVSLRSVYVNLKEVIPAVMQGLDGLINYLSFWKVVEWISLLFGGEYLDLSEISERGTIREITEVLDDIMTVGNSIRDNHEIMRNMFALNFVALILRFFKSFTTNPRLDVVIQTIVDCTPNVAHFFIVYFSLFVSFAFAGHFLFGSFVEGYSSVIASLFTRYRSAMTFEILNEMPVGHQILAYTWESQLQGEFCLKGEGV